MSTHEHVRGLQTGVVVVTYRSEASLPRLLSSLAEHESGLDVLVVDNASPTPPEVPKWCELMVLPENIGYGAACNRGGEALLSRGIRYLMMLNPDGRLQGPSITELASQMHDRPSVGVATGPIVDGDGQRVPSSWGPTSALRAIWFASGLRSNAIRRWFGRLLARGPAVSGASVAREELRVEGHVLGGAMMVRRACWERLDGFDEEFFLFWEDADLCERARQSGWEVWQLSCTPMIHEQGTSSAGVTDEQRWRWYVEGAERFASKHLTVNQRRRLLAALRWGRKLRR